MNKVFTKEQIEALKFMEKDFHTVLDLKYKRNNSRAEMEKISSIYEEATHEKISKDWACNVCQFNIVAKVGELYRKSVAYWAEEAQKEAEKQENTKIEEKIQENTEVKPRRAYKKKKE